MKIVLCLTDPNFVFLWVANFRFFGRSPECVCLFFGRSYAFSVVYCSQLYVSINLYEIKKTQKWFQPIMRYVVVLFVRDILYYVFANLEEEESFCIVTLTQTRNTLTNRLQTNMLFGWKANFLNFPAWV